MSSLTPRSIDESDRSAMSFAETEVAGTRLRAPEQAPVMKSTAGGSGASVKWKHRPDRAKIVAIYLAPGPQKAIAHKFGITPKTVSKIKTAKQHGHITAHYRMPLNAMLISLAFLGMA